MADHGHDITMTTRPGAQNAKTVLGVMERDTLDQAREDFSIGGTGFLVHAGGPFLDLGSPGRLPGAF